MIEEKRYKGEIVAEAKVAYQNAKKELHKIGER